ncbi:MAG: AAA family ATPase [Ignavibacteria bacterium]
MPITSHYPNQGFRIPYQEYFDKPDVLEKLLFIPEDSRNFKYATRPVSNDDALGIIERLLEIVKVMIEVDNTSENWVERKRWLLNLFEELWKSRGAYPGFIASLRILNFEKGIEYYKNECEQGNDKVAYEKICGFLKNGNNDIEEIMLEEKEKKALLRTFGLKSDSERKFLLDIVPRFYLSSDQINNIIADDRVQNNLYCNLEDINKNPYLLSENYIGDDIEDYISFHKIDHGVLPSPELGIENIFEKNDRERFRGLCVDQMKKITAHTFVDTKQIISRINERLSYLPDWKKEVFSKQYLEYDKEFLEGALIIRSKEEKKYFYLRNIYEDERYVEEVLRDLLIRPDIELRRPATEETFKDLLVDQNSLINNTAREDYFKAIISMVEKVHGSSGIFLMAPTGKASERIKEKTNKTASTIHSFLASLGWLNENLTFKKEKGKVSEEIKTLIIDESSMIDTSLFAVLFRAINWNCIQRLILVGDPNQLSPIGYGCTFFEIIEKLKSNYSENLGILNVNVRQLENRVFDKGTGILDLAKIFIQENQSHEIKTEKTEILKKIQPGGLVDKDLRIIYWNNEEELGREIQKVIIGDLKEDINRNKDFKDEENPSKLWYYATKTDGNERKADYMQVISPFRSECYGVDNLNILLQKLFNEFNVNISSLDGIALYDKVIQIRNRPKSNPISAYSFTNHKNEYIEIYNGEVGFAKPHPFDKKKCKWSNFRLKRFQVAFNGKENFGVNFGKNLGKDERNKWLPAESPEENLELGYVISVHKAQGSEFNRVYCILPKHKSSLLEMELLYTAITRASNYLCLFIQEDISTLLSLSRIEKSSLKRINSSIFGFNPLPEKMLSFIGWYKEGKVISTLTEYFVRSKSEMNIANILHLKEIPFRYEEPLFAKDGSMYLPDFTIEFRGKEYYWEHVGRLDLERYKSHWETKKAWYEKHFPGQLIITYESEMQSKDIEKVINEKFN